MGKFSDSFKIRVAQLQEQIKKQNDHIQGLKRQVATEVARADAAELAWTFEKEGREHDAAFVKFILRERTRNLPRQMPRS